ncbi:hypothetical protein BJ170DRAFT_495391 [Xylariales sp. AK1849]|nr:hypothetical protein BJ170DRAFT_495391 [Xylariales sp. AK1849]
MTRAPLLLFLSRPSLRLRVFAPHILQRHASTIKKNESSNSRVKQEQNQRPEPSLLRFVGPVSEEDVEPGELVRAVSRKHHFGTPKEVRRLKLNGMPHSGDISAFFAVRHCFAIQSMKYLDKVLHPYAQSVLDRYIADKGKPLWWSVAAFPQASPFVTSTAQRLLRRGIRMALETAGYDSDGRRLVTHSQDTAIRDIYGTLRVTCREPKDLCKAPFSEILEASKAIVTAAELALRRDKTGKHAVDFHNPQYQSSHNAVRRRTQAFLEPKEVKKRILE